MINSEYWFVFPLALLGAVVANATGAGGGVVFVPAFHILGVDKSSIIATSFAIQCFGMTAGLMSWRRLAKQKLQSDSQLERTTWVAYFGLIWRLAIPSCLGVLIGQYVVTLDSATQVVKVFKLFSFGFGFAILATTYLLWSQRNEPKPAYELNAVFYVIAIVVALIGGIITAWLSVGVGELIAVLFILMRFPVRFAIGVAVSVSAISVLVGVQYYLWFELLIDPQILIFAAPAALIGGTIAKRVVSVLSPIQLKIFIASWILISAAAM